MIFLSKYTAANRYLLQQGSGLKCLPIRCIRILPGRRRSDSRTLDETTSRQSTRSLSPEIQHELENLLFGEDQRLGSKQSKNSQENPSSLVTNQKSQLEKERDLFQKASKRAETRLRMIEEAKRREDERLLAETLNLNVQSKKESDVKPESFSTTWDDAHQYELTSISLTSADQEYKSLKQRNVSEPTASAEDWYINISSNVDSAMEKKTVSDYVPRWVKAQERARRRMDELNEDGPGSSEKLDSSRYITSREVLATLRRENAQNITVLDVRGKSDTHDYLIVMEARSERQLYHLMQAIRFKAKHRVPTHLNMPQNVAMEGKTRNAKDWFVLDLGSTIVHGFTNDSRIRYNIDEIWLYHDKPELSLNLDEFSPDLILRFLESNK